MTSYMDSQSKTYREPQAARSEYSSSRYDDFGYGAQQGVALMTPRSGESQNSATSRTANEVNNSNVVLERYVEDIFR